MGLLVLTRNSGQSVLIGDDIVIKVDLRKGSRQVKLTIDAPSDKLILREELVRYKRVEK
ncbi:MAG: carbon storage regulator [Gammaproteobacteria bacterium]|jgi:carbon storage regulator CsrA|nr:carbon storage regulator [Gammaproteobacteria bacterium]